jgi:hypothetical protein
MPFKGLGDALQASKRISLRGLKGTFYKAADNEVVRRQAAGGGEKGRWAAPADGLGGRS